ncbi:hypothetical protein JCM18905_3229 [Vibrio sp. JCM 18905]|nr:hypothetical protein JCM18905_3229 [Vibrio sp. JCM 18905]
MSKNKAPMTPEAAARIQANQHNKMADKSLKIHSRLALNALLPTTKNKVNRSNHHGKTKFCTKDCAER